MRKTPSILLCAGLIMVAAGASFLYGGWTKVSASQSRDMFLNAAPSATTVAERGFDVDVLVNGQPLEEYDAHGRKYVEALEGAEYELRIRNPLPVRVAVALSVDGLNTIDARHTTAWNASKWIIGPYETIHIGGWQMSSDRARRFYFTTELDSYGAKLGQTANLGVISAVFFRERRPPPPISITPAPPRRPLYEEDGGRDQKSRAPSASNEQSGAAKERRAEAASVPNDDYAATGIGRSVKNDVRWINMDLEPRPVAELSIRYEYYPQLVRLGILPRPYPEPNVLRRRERASGFEDRRFSPEP